MAVTTSRVTFQETPERRYLNDYHRSYSSIEIPTLISPEAFNRAAVRHDPGQNPYFAHTESTSTAIIPRLANSADPQRGGDPSLKPLHSHVGSFPYSPYVSFKTFGHGKRQEAQKEPLNSERLAKSWNGLSVHEEKPVALSARLPNPLTANEDQSITFRTANALRNTMKLGLKTTYQTQYTGNGPAMPYKLDNWDDFKRVFENNRHAASLDLEPHFKSTPTSARPLEGRIAKQLTIRPDRNIDTSETKSDNTSDKDDVQDYKLYQSKPEKKIEEINAKNEEIQKHADYAIFRYMTLKQDPEKDIRKYILKSEEFLEKLGSTQIVEKEMEKPIIVIPVSHPNNYDPELNIITATAPFLFLEKNPDVRKENPIHPQYIANPQLKMERSATNIQSTFKCPIHYTRAYTTNDIIGMRQILLSNASEERQKDTEAPQKEEAKESKPQETHPYSVSSHLITDKPKKVSRSTVLDDYCDEINKQAMLKLKEKIQPNYNALVRSQDAPNTLLSAREMLRGNVLQSELQYDLSDLSTSRTDIIKQFHSDYPIQLPDLRDHIDVGKRHKFFGYNAYYYQ